MKNRREKVVINKSFQHHYALSAVAMTVLLVNLFIIARLLFPMGAPLEFTPAMALSVGAIELLIIAAVWRASIRASHRVAGPVFVITRQLKAVGAGDFSARIKLRDRDMFREEADQINAALDLVQARIDTLRALATELQETQRAGQDTAPHVDRLVEELSGTDTSGETKP